MMSMRQGEKIFGTDGIRGRAGEGWLTPAGASAVGRAVGSVLAGRARTARGGKPGRVLLGHDGRRSGPELESSLARGYRAAGFDPVSVGLITTPGLALLTRSEDFRLGTMLSASHNPAEDNGIKVFTSEGDKLSDELEAEIEELLCAGVEPVPPPEKRTAGPPLDPELEQKYLEYLVDDAARGLELDGLRLVIDCANGGASRIGSRVFGRLGAQVHAIADQPDGDNINRGCGSTRPEALQDEVRKFGAALGVALDGDGDRCILVDESGQLVHGDGILTLVARHAQESGALAAPRIVATVMSNRGLHRALREVGVSVRTVDVGDRNVVEALREESLTLGGEQSGHIIFGADNHHIGDGLYTALRVVRVMRETGKPLSELASPYQPFPQVLVNVPVARKPHLGNMPTIAEEVRRIEEALGEDGRVLLRYSGTEPLARVMVEGPDARQIQDWAHALAELLTSEIGG